MFETRKSEIYGAVYFIGSEGEGDVKVGFTGKHDVTSRLKQLQTGSPTRYVVLGQVRAYPEIEKIIHRFLEPHRVRNDGEWFERKAALAILNRLKNSTRSVTGGFAEKLLIDTDIETSDDEQPLHQWLARNWLLNVRNACTTQIQSRRFHCAFGSYPNNTAITQSEI